MVQNQNRAVQPLAPEGAVNEPKVPVIQRKILYSWRSPMRHFKKINIKRFLIILAIVLAFSVVLVLVRQYFLMGAIAAVMFLLYVVGTIAPATVEHRLTTIGIETIDTEYKWADLHDFWFTKRDEQMVLNVDTRMAFPGRVIMLVNDEDVPNIYDILKSILSYRDMRSQKGLGKIVDGEWVNMLTEEEQQKKK